jgi:hypothetical protein
MTNSFLVENITRTYLLNQFSWFNQSKGRNNVVLIIALFEQNSNKSKL